VLKYWCAARRGAVLAGRDALAAIGADLRPALGVWSSRAAGQQIERPLCNGDGIGRVEPGRFDHRASLDALAAARAGVEDTVDLPVHDIEKRGA